MAKLGSMIPIKSSIRCSPKATIGADRGAAARAILNNDSLV
jgi:hypothetical protein